ncbi:hypothetical protein [Streptomyces sp. C36]|uniref:hypothetical protein n=1 Tax=Streptomyces sp. C36 TaxID=3237122 RepID=UPI0034C62CA1
MVLFLALAPADTAQAGRPPVRPEASAASAAPESPSAVHPTPTPQSAPLTFDGILRTALPGFVAGLGSGTVLAVIGWAAKKVTANRRSEP